MHRTHLPLLTWAHAIYLIVSSSKGISAMKLADMLGVSYSAAWFVGHRVRAMMAEDPGLLSGIVEIDETYAGAPPRKRAKSNHDDLDPPSNPRGRGTARPLLLVAAERNGHLATKVIETHSRAAVSAALNDVLDINAVVMTDGLPAYHHLGADRTHLIVTHSRHEFARTDAKTGYRVHINRIESFNSLLVRATVGVFHSISRKHLDRYALEMAFRWNHKVETCLVRMQRLLRNGVGRTLPYHVLVGGM